MSNFGSFSQSSTPQPPWHMWGNTVTWQLQGNPLEQQVVATQVCKMSYKRPETWAFWLAGRVISHTPQLETKSIVLNFDIITGVGRSSFDTDTKPTSPFINARPFCRMVWILPFAPNSLDFRSRKYTTQVRGTPLIDNAPATDPDADGMLIDRIVGQDIQVLASLQLNSFDVPGINRVVVEASAYFAPLSHVRPEWFVEQFPGDEVGGT